MACGTKRKLLFKGVPFALQVFVGFIIGAVIGHFAGHGQRILGVTTEDLGQLGILVIRLLKALAVLLVFFTSLDALMNNVIPARSGLRLLAICGVNVSVAFAIGLTLMNTIQPGRHWEGELSRLLEARPAITSTPKPGAPTADFNVIHNLQGYVPESVMEPFLFNNVVSIVLTALLLGVAFWRQRASAQRVLADLGPSTDELGPEDTEQAVQARRTLQHLEQLANVVNAGSQLLVGALEIVLFAVPYGVLGIVAMTVGRSNLGLFVTLGGYMGTILAGLFLHSLVYYPTVAWLLARRSPCELWRGGSAAVSTALTTSSSLATVPVTLRCLQKLGVSSRNARLAACIATNLNNDGITLYEAMAALFLAQGCGFHLSFGQQLVVVVASLMAGIGVAGVPEAGLVVLPLVLGAAGLPEQVVVAALPLVLPVDWMIGRVRAAINVMSDMLVAILLDAWEAKLVGTASAVKEVPELEANPASPSVATSIV